MKKIVLLLIALLSAVCLFSACNGHTAHTYGGWVVTKEATCTEGGSNERTCTYEGCSEKETEYTVALGHDCEWEVVTEAACEAAGSKEYVCIRCEAVIDTEAIPALGHNHEWTVKTPATCQSEGLEEYICSVCGDLADSRAIPVDDDAHVYGEWVYDEEPDCENSGQRHRDCTVEGCDHTESESVGALGHSHEWTVKTPATCDGDGLKEYKCTVCGDVSDTEIIPQLTHEYEWTVTTPETCHTDGLREEKCIFCGDVIDSEVIPSDPDAHVYGEWVYDEEPDCENSGQRHRGCTVEGCDHTESESVGALGHNSEWTVKTPATCDSEGLEEYKCTVCGDVEDTRAISTLEHDCEWIETTPATCGADGLEEYKCKNCGEATDSRVLPADPDAHVYGDYGYCEECGDYGFTGPGLVSYLDREIVELFNFPKKSGGFYFSSYSDEDYTEYFAIAVFDDGTVILAALEVYNDGYAEKYLYEGAYVKVDGDLYKVAADYSSYEYDSGELVYTNSYFENEICYFLMTDSYVYWDDYGIILVKPDAGLSEGDELYIAYDSVEFVNLAELDMYFYPETDYLVWTVAAYDSEATDSFRISETLMLVYSEGEFDRYLLEDWTIDGEQEGCVLRTYQKDGVLINVYFIIYGEPEMEYFYFGDPGDFYIEQGDDVAEFIQDFIDNYTYEVNYNNGYWTDRYFEAEMFQGFDFSAIGSFTGYIVYENFSIPVNYIVYDSENLTVISYDFYFQYKGDDPFNNSGMYLFADETGNMYGFEFYVEVFLNDGSWFYYLITEEILLAARGLELTKFGLQTVVFTFDDGFEAEMEIFIFDSLEPPVCAIDYYFMDFRYSLNVGEDFFSNNPYIRLSALNYDYRDIYLTSDMIEGLDTSVPGYYTVTVDLSEYTMFMKLEFTFEIIVADGKYVTGYSIASLDSYYDTGFSDFALTVYYSDGTDETVSAGEVTEDLFDLILSERRLYFYLLWDCDIYVPEQDVPYLYAVQNASAQVDTEYYIDLYTYIYADYKFIPETSGYYEIYSYNNNGDPYVRLYDSGYEQLTANDDGGGNRNFYLNYYLEAGETYYIRATSWSANFASYWFKVIAEGTVDPVDPVDTVEMELDEEYSVTFGYGESVFYEFTAPATGIYYLYTYDKLTKGFLDMDFVSGTGNYNYEYSSLDNGNFAVMMYLEEGETYVFEVYAHYRGYRGDFKLKIVALDDALTLIPDLENGTVIAHRGEGLTYMFKTTVSESGLYVLKTGAFRYENYDEYSYNIWVIDADFNHLGGNNFFGAGALDLDLTAGETYFIFLYMSSYIDVTVSLKTFEDSAETVYGGEENRFTAEIGTSYYFEAEVEGGYNIYIPDNYDSYLYIYSYNGVLNYITSGWADKGNTFSVYLTAGEGIYIRVKNNIADLMIFDDEALFYYLYPALTIGEYVTLEPESDNSFSLTVTDEATYALFAPGGQELYIEIYDESKRYLTSITNAGYYTFAPGRYIITVYSGSSFMAGTVTQMLEEVYEELETGEEYDVCLEMYIDKIFYFIPETDEEIYLFVYGNTENDVHITIYDKDYGYLYEGTNYVSYAFTAGEYYIISLYSHASQDFKLSTGTVEEMIEAVYEELETGKEYDIYLEQYAERSFYFVPETDGNLSLFVYGNTESDVYIVIYDKYYDCLYADTNYIIYTFTAGDYIIIEVYSYSAQDFKFSTGTVEKMIEARYERLEAGTENDLSFEPNDKKEFYFVPEEDGDLTLFAYGNLGGHISIKIYDLTLNNILGGNNSVSCTFTAGGYYIIGLASDVAQDFKFRTGTLEEMVEARYEKLETETEYDLHLEEYGEKIFYFIPETDGDLFLFTYGNESDIRIGIFDINSNHIFGGDNVISCTFTAGKYYTIHLFSFVIQDFKFGIGTAGDMLEALYEKLETGTEYELSLEENGTRYFYFAPEKNGDLTAFVYDNADGDVYIEIYDIYSYYGNSAYNTLGYTFTAGEYCMVKLTSYVSQDFKFKMGSPDQMLETKGYEKLEINTEYDFFLKHFGEKLFYYVAEEDGYFSPYKYGPNYGGVRIYLYDINFNFLTEGYERSVWDVKAGEYYLFRVYSQDNDLNFKLQVGNLDQMLGTWNYEKVEIGKEFTSFLDYRGRTLYFMPESDGVYTLSVYDNAEGRVSIGVYNINMVSITYTYNEVTHSFKAGEYYILSISTEIDQDCKLIIEAVG